MKKKLMKNLLLVLVMTVLCFAVGVTASAYDYEAIFEQGYATSEQTLLSFNLNGGTMADPVDVFDIETNSFESTSGVTNLYVMVPKTEEEQKAGTYITLPNVTAPQGYIFQGWFCYADTITYPPNYLYKIPDGYGGNVIEIMASYSKIEEPPSPPANLVDGAFIAGENLTWSFDETTGTLTISGKGPMYDFGVVDDKRFIIPWQDYYEDIRTVIIGEGVTTIGDDAFLQCINLTNIEMPDTITKIGEEAFSHCISLKKLKLPENLNYIGLNAVAVCIWLDELIFPKNIKLIDELALVYNFYCDKIYIKSMDVEFGSNALNVSDFSVNDLSQELCFEYIKRDLSGDLNAWEEFEEYITYADDIVYLSTIYCHAGSTAEAYAIENGVPYVLTHFFEGDWTYDYDNMIRYRKCIHCDELETEALETTTDSDVEIIEPADPDTDFVVDVITDYVVIEETISNNVAGDFEIVKAFDITMKNKDGVHVQPDGTVKVKLPLDWSKDGVYKVYRVNDDGTLTDMNAYREGSHMVFETDHFSVYVIVDESEKADEPTTPDEPQEETKKDFFSKIIDWFRSLIDLIISWFKK